MSKAWAKIVVRLISMDWYIDLESDQGGPITLARVTSWHFNKEGRVVEYRTKYHKKKAITQARAWSLSLRGIPVEVEE